MAFKTSTKTARSTNTDVRRPITFELVTSLCPDPQIAHNIATRFGLDPVDYDGIRDMHGQAFRLMGDALDLLNEKAGMMHFQRVVGSLVGSAFGAAQFYTQKVSEARDLTSKLANDHRDEDRDGPTGFDSKAQRARQFAAELGLQAFAQLAAAEGAVTAYREIVGEAWKPYAAPADNSRKVDRQAAAAEIDTFG